MSNEIKQGDKVRVSEDIPMFYRRYNSYRVFEVEHQVVDIEDEIALLDSIPSKYVTTIPTKYLVKVDAEAKEAKIKKGDKVRYIGNDQPEYRGSLFIIDGDVFFNDHFNQWQASSIKIKTTDTWGICNVPLSDLILCTERTAPTIKVGADGYEYADKQVWNCKSHKHGIIKRIIDGGAEVFTEYGEHKVWPLMDLVDEYDEPFEKWKSTEPTDQTEAEQTNHTISIPVEVDLTDSYWDAYTADLAKEVALKVANKFNDPKEAAEYAVSVAKAVVEGLKRK